MDDYIIHQRGMGYSWNWGIQNASHDYILQLEDDWEMVNRYADKNEFENELNKRIKVLDHSGGIYSFDAYKTSEWESGFSELCHEGYDFFELNKPRISDFYKRFNMYFYSNHPHLKHKSLHEKIGWYKEEVPPHEVEIDMCKKYYQSGQRVFQSMESDFVHLGEISSRGER